MEVTFLGTGSGAPTRARNVAGTALHLPQRAEWWLFDCGEGTQHQILRAPHVRPSQLTRVFLTHLHGDHLFGLPGLLATRALAQNGSGSVVIYAPDGAEQWLRATLRASGMRFGFPVSFVTIQNGMVFEDDTFRVVAGHVRHRIEAYAFSITEREQAGRFDAEAANRLGIPNGPLRGELKAGNVVTLPDGRVIDGATLVGPTRPGRKLTISGDTGFCPELIALAAGSDLLIHEATYSDADRVLAERASHSTARIAAEVARSAKVKSLVLTHFSARYEGGEGVGSLDDLLLEAREIFPATRLAHDLLKVPIPRQEPPLTDSASSQLTTASNADAIPL